MSEILAHIQSQTEEPIMPAMKIFRHDYGFDNYGGKLATHADMPCEVIRQLGPEECDPECQPLYRIRFADGFECDAFEEELGDASAYLRGKPS